MADHPTAMARVGKYLMLDLLGEGAFGKVRLAIDETTGRDYAIKIMQKSHIKANELTLQVRREIAVMKAMRHPNIVNLHEVLTSSNNLYMVMDLVTGGELFEAVAEEGRIQEHLARSYFQQLVDGVHYCHSRRVYHRDLKPENLLLSADKQTVKITDFGLSSIKAQNASSELLHTIMGSPHYIAPEIITSAANGYDGAKVDVWASGVILFGMLAGHLPFDQPNTRALYKAIVQDPVKYPPHFSYDVIKLLKAMLQKDPQKRPTMEQVKSFTWFNVNYNPALAADKMTPQDDDKSDRRKLRHKLRKHGERRRKKDKHDENTQSAHGRLDALKHGRRKRQIVDNDNDSQHANLSTKSSLVVEVCTNNLTPDSSATQATASLAATPVADPQPKENVDPAKHITESSRDTKSSQPAPMRSFSDRSDATRGNRTSDAARIFSRPSNQAKSAARSSDASRSRSGDSGKSNDLGILPARSFTKLSNVARSFTKSRFRSSSSKEQIAKDVSHSFTKKESSASTLKIDSASRAGSLSSVADSSASRVDSLASRVASFSSQASVTQTDVSRDVPDSIIPQSQSDAKTSDCQIANEPDEENMQQRRLSSRASSNAVAEFAEKEQQQAAKSTIVPMLSVDKGKSCDQGSGEGESNAALEASKGPSSSGDFEPVSPTNFISPISINSKASFKSIAHKGNMGGAATDGGDKINANLTLPSNLESPISHHEIHTPRAVVANGDDETGVASVRGFEEGMTPVNNSVVKSSIFKPMTGLLESLALNTPKENKESMSPSVFCPEVDADEVEGTSEWCIDCVEVFADVETGEKVEVEETVLKEVVEQDGGVEDVDTSNGASGGPLSGIKPIFGPLSQELELKLSPSMEGECDGGGGEEKK